MSESYKRLNYKERQEKLQEMRVGRIDKAYLLELVLDYKIRKNIMPEYPMPTELAEVLIIVVDKMLGAGNWRNYSEDWKEEMRGRSIEHLVKYAHNFSQKKSEAGKGNDPYNYFAMIVYSAFVQSWHKCKKYAEMNVELNEDVLQSNSGLDEDVTSQSSSVDSVTPNTDALDWGHF